MQELGQHYWEPEAYLNLDYRRASHLLVHCFRSQHNLVLLGSQSRHQSQTNADSNSQPQQLFNI